MNGDPCSHPTSTGAPRVYYLLSACLTAGYGALFTIVGDYRERYGISESSIGMVIGIGFVAGFVAQVLFAPAADRGNARRMVLAAVIVNAFGLLLMGFGTDLATIVTGRLISGLALGWASPAIRRIVVVSEPDHIGRNLGRLVSAEVFGFGIGPVVSALLVDPFGLGAPFTVIAVLSLVAAAGAWRVPVIESRQEVTQRLALDLLTHRPFAGAVLLGATVYLMIGTFDALWDVVHVDLGTPNWIANLGITLFALPLVVLGPIGGRLAQSRGPFLVAGVGLAIGAVFMASYGVAPSGLWIFSLAMVHAVSDGLSVAASGIAIGLTAPEHRQAGAQGVLGAAQAITAGVAAVATGRIYESFGRAAAYGATALVMLVLVGAGLTLALGARRTAHAPVN